MKTACCRKQSNNACCLRRLSGAGESRKTQRPALPPLNQQGEIEADADWWATMQAAGKYHERSPVRCCPAQFPDGRGAALSNKLAKINLHTVQDLPYTFPCATKIAPISTPSENYTGRLCHGRRRSTELQYLLRRRRMMTCQISDGSGILTMRFSTSTRQ